MISLQYSYAKFSRDSVHQKLLKSVYFRRVIQNKKGALFETHAV